MIFFRKLYFLIFIVLIALATALNAQPGNSKKNLEKKKKKLEEEIAMLNKMLKETGVSKKLSISQIIILKKKIEMREDLIQTIQQEVNKVNGTIQTTNNNIDRLQKDLAKLKKEYAKMLVHAQKQQSLLGDMNDLVFIFSSHDFYQAYQRLKYIQQYEKYREKQGKEIIKNKTELQTQLVILTQQLEEKKQLLGEQEEAKQTLSQEKSEEEQSLQQIQKKEKELRVELNKKKKQSEELQMAIKKLIEDEIKRKNDEAEKLAKAKKEKVKVEKNIKTSVPILSNEAEMVGNNFEANRGKILWPVSEGFICVNYGEYEHPAIKGFKMFNSGVEICSQKQLKVQSVFTGEVTGIALSPMGGKLVIIRHGEYLTVYSNLKDITVKQGDQVKAKQIIGTVMYNESDSNYSLNFQIWKGQKTLDPKSWLAN